MTRYEISGNSVFIIQLPFAKQINYAKYISNVFCVPLLASFEPFGRYTGMFWDNFMSTCHPKVIFASFPAMNSDNMAVRRQATCKQRDSMTYNSKTVNGL
jgi:hypothetical protein